MSICRTTRPVFLLPYCFLPTSIIRPVTEPESSGLLWSSPLLARPLQCSGRPTDYNSALFPLSLPSPFLFPLPQTCFGPSSSCTPRIFTVPVCPCPFPRGGQTSLPNTGTLASSPPASDVLLPGLHLLFSHTGLLLFLEPLSPRSLCSCLSLLLIHFLSSLPGSISNTSYKASLISQPFGIPSLFLLNFQGPFFLLSPGLPVVCVSVGMGAVFWCQPLALFSSVPGTCGGLSK